MRLKPKVQSVTNLATNAALAAVEDKIPNVSNFVKNWLWHKLYSNWIENYWSLSW